VQLPDDIGRLTTGDLILTGSGDQPVRGIEELSGPQWSKLGMVVKPSDFGLELGAPDQAVLVYSPEAGELRTSAEVERRLRDRIGKVMVCKLDPGSTTHV
jgi:hypothetical protein